MPKKNQVKVDVIVDDKGTMKKSAVGAHSVDRRLKGAAQASSGASKNFSKMAQGISGGLVPAYATLAASLFALDAVYRALSSAADLRILQEGQLAFAKSTGQAMNAVAGAVQRATQFQVSFKEAAQASAIAASAGFGTSQIVALGKAANDAAKVLGRSVPDAFDRLIRGVVKAEPEVLDELGIILRLDDAAERYALQMNLTASELTVFEKQQAVLNDVLDQAENKFGAVADSIDPNPWTQLGVALEKVKDDFAIMISSVLEPIATFLSGNAYAALAAMGVFISSIMKGLIPSYAEQSARFVESQNAQQLEIDQTIAKLNELKTAQAGGTEALGMAEGRAQGLAQKAAPAGKRTTLGKLQRGQVISAKQASKEILRVEQLKNKRIEGLTRKQTADYVRHLKTIEAESKVSTKKMEWTWQGFKLKSKITFKSIGLSWKATMMSMQTYTTIASRAMSVAMSAMGWIGIITMVYQGLMAWKDSTKEVDEAQERLKAKTDDLTKTYKDLAYTFDEMSKKMDDVRDSWISAEAETLYYSNTLKNIPIEDTIDLLETLDGKAVPKELRDVLQETFDNMKKIVPAVRELSVEMDTNELKKYVDEFKRYSLAVQEIAGHYKTAGEAETKWKKAQKDRIEGLIKSDYKKELRELVTLVKSLTVTTEDEKRISEGKTEALSDEAKKMVKYRAELEFILDLRYKELEVQRETIALAYEEGNLYKFQKNALAELKAERQEFVKIADMQNKVDAARKAMGEFGEMRIGTKWDDMEYKLRAKAGKEYEFAESQVAVARLEFEQQIEKARLVSLNNLKDQWIAGMDEVVNAIAAGMQKGIMGMLKGEKNIKEVAVDMLKGVGDVMAKRLSESMTENIMSFMPETKAEKSRKAEAKLVDEKQTALITANDQLKEVTQTSIDVQKQQSERALLLIKAMDENTTATKENTHQLGGGGTVGSVQALANLEERRSGMNFLQRGADPLRDVEKVEKWKEYLGEDSTAWTGGKKIGGQSFGKWMESQYDTKERADITPEIRGKALDKLGSLEYMSGTGLAAGDIPEGAMAEFLKAATDPGSIYVHDTHLEALISDLAGGSGGKGKLAPLGIGKGKDTEDGPTGAGEDDALTVDISEGSGDVLSGKLGSSLGGMFGDMFGGLTDMFSGMFGGGGGFMSLFGFASGGYVGKKGVQFFGKGGKVKGFGKDTVPAMLSPGEMVLTPSQLKGLGGSVNNTSITVNMGAGETVQTDVQGNKTQGKLLAMAITGAVTKEIAKQKKPGGTLWVGGPRGY